MPDQTTTAEDIAVRHIHATHRAEDTLRRIRDLRDISIARAQAAGVSAYRLARRADVSERTIQKAGERGRALAASPADEDGDAA